MRLGETQLPPPFNPFTARHLQQRSAMQSSAMVTRMAKEIRMLQNEPPPGVWAAPKGDKVTELEAQIQVRGGRRHC